MAKNTEELTVVPAVEVTSHKKNQNKLGLIVTVLIVLGLSVAVLIMGFNKSPALKAETIASDQGYTLQSDDSIRSDCTGQSLLTKIQDDLFDDVESSFENSKERCAVLVYDVGSKGGKDYLLKIDVKNKTIDQKKVINDEDMGSYYRLADAVKSFHE